MTKHSPAPWRAEGWNNLIVNDVNGNTIITCPGAAARADIEEYKANARLIAAAPSLLLACLSLIQAYGTGEEKDLDRAYELAWDACIQAGEEKENEK